MTASTKRKVIHCWEDRQDFDREKSYTCLLEDGHDGKHEWTDDENITMEFGT